jgi:CubicO group peptidase (beta-lactamase class C family)
MIMATRPLQEAAVSIPVRTASRHTALLALGCAMIILGIRPSEAEVEPAIAQRISRICDQIPPAVIIEGERSRQTTLMALMKKLHVPGVSVAVIHGGKIEWARGFGIRNAAGDPVTPATLFQAGSISKPITAFAALRAMDSGKLDLDSNVNRYLESWKVPNNPLTAKRRVTLRELLSHTAGITVPGFGGYPNGVPLPSLLQILNGKPPAENAPILVDEVPDTIWRYSGGGYVIIRELLQDVTHEPFGRLVQGSVLVPSGMMRSTFDQPLPNQLRGNAAIPYDRNGNPVSTGAAIFPELAPDGLWSTPSDLARFVIQVQQALAGAPGALISAQTAHLMLTPRFDHYGLGVVVGDDPDHPWFTHNGGNYGFPCVFVAYERGDGAVIMSDGQNGFELEANLLRSIAQEYGWPDLRPRRYRPVLVGTRDLDRLVGAYWLSPGNFAVISRKGDRLFFQSSSLGRQPMYPLSPTDFVVKEGSLDYFFNRIDEIKLTFALGGHGKAVGLALSQNGSHPSSTADRIQGAKGRAVIAEMRAIDRRFQLQKAAGGGESALRALLRELARGTTRYEDETPILAEYLTSIVTLNQRAFARVGPVVSITFRHVSSVGVDTYHVVFRNGHGDIDLSLNAHGKMEYVQYFPG